jgi:hypothetical protein
MQEKAEHVIKAATGLSYGLSGTLYAADILDVLNHYAGAIGAIVAILTFFTNFVFQCLNRRTLKSQPYELRPRNQSDSLSRGGIYSESRGPGKLD